MLGLAVSVANINWVGRGSIVGPYMVNI